ncbi:10568_t:CDS:1, partial [Gigaspora rosea]
KSTAREEASFKEVSEIKIFEVISSNIIRHPQDKKHPVVEKSTLYVRESYKDLHHLKHLQLCFLIYLLIQILCDFENITVIFQLFKVDPSIALRTLTLASVVMMTFSNLPTRNTTSVIEIRTD